ncbi:hypothetical protein EC988_000907 [Linderina pennispora]|nr:hypothetical protein EC988_000907 [Linderina pennispora]
MAGKRKVEAVLLGFSDGDMAASDDTDAFTCKLGGKPVWLDTASAIPSQASTAVCQQCGSGMIQLLQAYVPLNDSAYDRVLYVWACNRRECSGKAGAARAVRGHVLNREYAMKLIHSAKASKPKQSTFGSGPFGSGKVDFGSVWKTNAGETSAPMFSGPLFGSSASKISFGKAEPEELAEELADDLADDLAVLEIDGGERTEWVDVVQVPAQYLAIDEEVLETPAADEQDMQMEQAALGDDVGGEQWSGEQYERTVRPQGTDAAFERFVETVAKNPAQTIRYQFGGSPLFYSFQDSTAQMLGPTAHDDSDDEDAAPRRYSTDRLPRCQHCSGRRVFECQLMPALLTVLPLAAHVKGQGKTEMDAKWVQRLDLGVEFGTMMVFSCENDCHGGRTGTQYLGNSGANMDRYAAPAYYEECVLVQLESMQA